MARSILFSLCFITTFLLIQGANSAEFTFKNTCPYPVYPGILTGAGVIPLRVTGFKLESGRIWVRALCTTRRFSCASADSGSGQLECNNMGVIPPKRPTSDNGQPPATLVEFTRNGANNEDFYDISNVDGFNLSISIVPSSSTTCTANLLAGCPQELWTQAFNSDQYCYLVAFGAGPQECKPSSSSLYFKKACTHAYSYVYFSHGTFRLTHAAVKPLPVTRFKFEPGASFIVTAPPKWLGASIFLTVPPKWSGRMSTGTLCTTDSNGRFSRASADCGSGQLECNNRGAIPPATLVDFTLNGANNVDGFNLPISIMPSSSTACTANLDCTVVGCKSAHLVFDTMTLFALLLPFSLPFLFKMICLSYLLLILIVGLCLLLSVVPLDHDPDLLDLSIETGSDSGSDLDDLPSLETISDEPFNSETGLNGNNQYFDDDFDEDDEREITYINGRVIRLNPPIACLPQQDPRLMFEREILCMIPEGDEDQESEIVERPRVGFRRRVIRKCRSLFRCSCFI